MAPGEFNFSSRHISLPGFGIEGYRSLHAEVAVFAPLAKVTFLAGQNNAGKSNVLRFCDRLLNHAPPSLSDDDRPIDTVPQDWQTCLWLPRVRPDMEELRAVDHRLPTALKPFLDSPEFQIAGSGDEVMWFKFVLSTDRMDRGRCRWLPGTSTLESIEARLSPQDGANLRFAANVLSGSQLNGGSVRHDTERLVPHFMPKIESMPPVRLIEAFRQIRPGSNAEEDLGIFDGVGLVERLEQLERPSHGRAADREKFAQINRFVRFVLEDDTATLSIPHDAQTVLVERSGHLLPLGSLGTGVQQVVMLAAAATILENHLVMIEEPEVHLHPLLQRRLVRYLDDATSNQYLIATHSAHLLDHGSSSVFHLTHTQGGGTRVNHAGSPHALASICTDLGYRPSDLLQSNVILWVEGPSDRIYLRHWLNTFADRPLIEGIDYSIMFYGGGLLSHLSPDDPAAGGLAEHEHDQEVADFISLRRLNRHLVVLIDSDKRSAHKHLTPTKQRVRSAFDASEGPGFAWITKGYTIENYVPADLLREAVGAVHPKLRLVSSGGQWEPPLELRRAGAKSAEGKPQANKVAIAKYVCARWEEGDMRVFDLVDQAKRVVRIIEEANGRPGSA